MMSPVDRLERMEKKIDKILEEQIKTGRITAVHGVKIKHLEDTQNRSGNKVWSVAMLALSALVGAISSRLTKE